MIPTILEDFLIDEALNDLKIAGDRMNETQAPRTLAHREHTVVGRLPFALNGRSEHRIRDVSDPRQMLQRKNNGVALGYEILRIAADLQRSVGVVNRQSVIVEVMC